MAMKLVLLLMIIFMKINSNKLKADDETQIESPILENYYGNKFSSTLKSSSKHFVFRSRRSAPSCKICGVANLEKKIRTAVIKGDDVEPPNKYPWMVNIKKRLGTDGKTNTKYICAGSIISELFILTANHCVFRNKKTKEIIEAENLIVSFVSATYDVKKGPEIDKIISHPEHESFLKNDIALLKLKSKISCDKYKMPICLPPANFDLPKNAVLIGSGWGLTKADDQKSSSKKLQEGKFMADKIDSCPVPPDMDKKQHICLKGLNRQVTCEGDSGGPAFYKRGNKFYVVGVLSSGTCCTNHPRMIYTSVIYHLNWIKEHTGLLPGTADETEETTRNTTK